MINHTSRKARITLSNLFSFVFITLLPFSASASTNTNMACAGQENWPTKILDADNASMVDTSQFISEQQLEDWAFELDAVGLRATGNEAHEAYIDRLAARLACAGINDIWFEPVPFTRWLAKHWELNAVHGDSTEPVRVASYAPYSGSTTPDGVTAPLTYLAPDTEIIAENVADKIVLFEVTQLGYPVWALALLSIGIHDLQNLNLFEYYSRPYLSIDPIVEVLEGLEDAGAAGSIAVLPTAYETAYGSYFPYDGKVRDIPTLYVDMATGAQLKILAASDSETQLNLTLEAEVEETTTRNLFGLIPGMSDELTVVNSHTDGTNALEDNGPDAMIGMAQYLNRLPQSELPRSILFMFSAAHFAHGISIRDFLASHEDDGLLNRIATVVTIEHLAAQKWNINYEGQLVATGKPEIGVFFQPPIKALAELSFDALRNADAGPGAVLHPWNRSADGIEEAAWAGEGQYFWSLARIPTANYITGPNYLLNWGISTADKIDYDRMWRQMISFTQMQLNLGLVPREEFDKEFSWLWSRGTQLPGINWGN